MKDKCNRMIIYIIFICLLSIIIIPTVSSIPININGAFTPTGYIPETPTDSGESETGSTPYVPPVEEPIDSEVLPTEAELTNRIGVVILGVLLVISVILIVDSRRQRA